MLKIPPTFSMPGFPNNPVGTSRNLQFCLVGVNSKEQGYQARKQLQRSKGESIWPVGDIHIVDELRMCESSRAMAVEGGLMGEKRTKVLNAGRPHGRSIAAPPAERLTRSSKPSGAPSERFWCRRISSFRRG